MSESEKPVEPELPTINFKPPEGLPNEELTLRMRQLSNVAFRYGFKLETVLPVTAGDEELENHYQETYPPPSREDYLGKEHFWRVGEEVGLERSVSGTLFGRLAYPLMSNAKSGDKIIETAKLGLIVRDRRDVNVPQPPTGSADLTGGGLARNVGQALHAEIAGGNRLPPQAAVIQIGGIINLADNPKIAATIAGLSGARLEHLTRFAYRLRQLVAEEPTGN